MLLRRSVLFIFAFTLIAYPAFAANRGSQSTRRKSPPITPRILFQGLYSQADSAIDKKDLDGGLAYYDSDYVRIDRDGNETDVGDIRYQLSTLLDLAKSVSYSSSVVSANIMGINGTVMIRTNLSLVLINPDSHAKGYFVYKTVCKDSWMHQDGGWTIERSQLISSSAIMNGHTVADINDPFAPPPTDDDITPSESNAPNTGSG